MSISCSIIGQSGISCIGVVAGIIRRKSDVTFNNYTGFLDVTGNSCGGAVGGLVGEMSLDITKCTLNNGQLTVSYFGLTNDGWNSAGGMMGWLSNATLVANNVSISINDQNKGIPLAVGKLAYSDNKNY